MPNELELVMEPQSRVFAADDERWQAQVSDLLADLKDSGAGVRNREEPVEGTKGGAAEIILALGSAGVVAAAVTVIRAWLDRDARQQRSLRLSWRDGDQHRELQVSGEGMSQKALTDLISRSLPR